ncbi:hypothetical protein NPIL_92191 [Nephila pilipes]|uniref:Uncharacterized protein n=1 Tax=Nephila pilipes TaxID=299642 RepID=A0A8X6IPT1_NEPPI|nr:hypothetical protein NPIL_92191 [Nephila pilipes]
MRTRSPLKQFNATNKLWRSIKNIDKEEAVKFSTERNEPRRTFGGQPVPGTIRETQGLSSKAEIQKILYDDSEAESSDNEELETYVQDEGEDSDTVASENIEEWEEDSCSDQNNTDSRADENGDVRHEQYTALRKHRCKVIDSYYWNKILFTTKRKRTKSNLLVKLPGVKAEQTI